MAAGSDFAFKIAAKPLQIETWLPVAVLGGRAATLSSPLSPYA